MFFPPTDEEKGHQSTTKTHIKPRRKCKKKLTAIRNVNNKIFKKKQKFAHTMSSWAEHFTVAATWQIKHQLAYWKARAKSLEYENNILHDIIRKNCLDQSENHSESNDITNGLHIRNIVDSSESESEVEEEVDDEEEGFEVSEEFIEFLKANAKYKEEARLERERLKAKVESANAIADMEAGPSRPPDKSVDLKTLYGANWQRIAALETYIHSNFIHESDQTKPMYWPNIPFNFS